MTKWRALHRWREPGALFVVLSVAVVVLGEVSLAGVWRPPGWTGLAWHAGHDIPRWIPVLWGAALLAMVGALRRPGIALASYLVVAYAVQGTEPAYRIAYAQGVLHWAIVLAVTACALWMTARGKRDWWYRDPLTITLSLFFVWIALTFVVAEMAGRDGPPRWNREPVYFVHCLAVFWLTSHFLRTRLEIRLVTALVCVTLLLRWWATPGNVYNESYLASYLAIAFPLALGAAGASRGLLVRTGLLAVATLLVVLIFDIANRAAVLGFIAGLIAYFASHRRVIRGAAYALLALVVVATVMPRTAVWERFQSLAVNFTLDNERTRLIRGGIDIAADHPLFGIGPGQFPNVIYDYTTGITRGGRLDAHNSFIEVLAETGYPGLLLFVAVIALAAACQFRIVVGKDTAPWLRAYARGLLAALATFIVISVFNSRHDMILLYFVLGLTVGARRRSTDPLTTSARDRGSAAPTPPR